MPSSASARVLGVGVVQLEQHVLGVLDQRRDAPRAQAQQAEHRQVLGMHREQHVAPQDEGHAHVARRDVVVDQEVGADVQLAVVFFVEARRFLEVVVDDVVGDGQAELARDPGLLFGASAPPCRPTPAAAGRAGPGDRLLPGRCAAQAAVVQREHVQHQRLRRARAAASPAPWGLREGSAATVSPRGPGASIARRALAAGVDGHRG